MEWAKEGRDIQCLADHWQFVRVVDCEIYYNIWFLTPA
jgi:hypothetical protein